jgi:hypothetical protein
MTRGSDCSSVLVRAMDGRVGNQVVLPRYSASGCDGGVRAALAAAEVTLACRHDRGPQAPGFRQLRPTIMGNRPGTASPAACITRVSARLARPAQGINRRVRRDSRHAQDQRLPHVLKHNFTSKAHHTEDRPEPGDHLGGLRLRRSRRSPTFATVMVGRPGNRRMHTLRRPPRPTAHHHRRAGPTAFTDPGPTTRRWRAGAGPRDTNPPGIRSR